LLLIRRQNPAHDSGGVIYFVVIFSMLTRWMQILTNSIAERISSRDGNEGAIRIFRFKGSLR
jgi:hypothetical protein